MTFEVPSPEVLAGRVKMALAEAGWPDWPVVVRRGVVCIRMGIPEAVAWTAYEAAGVRVACWSCWAVRSGDRDRSVLCFDGDCQAGPDEPRRPPRELLLRREP